MHATLALTWMIDELTINGRPQFDSSIPGDVFDREHVDSFVMFEAAGPGCEIVFRVRYTGDNPAGEPFYAGLVGTGIGQDGRPGRQVLPISSSGIRIAA